VKFTQIPVGDKKPNSGPGQLKRPQAFQHGKISKLKNMLSDVRIAAPLEQAPHALRHTSGLIQSGRKANNLLLIETSMICNFLPKRGQQ
jgi:hypothetical protein